MIRQIGIGSVAVVVGLAGPATTPHVARAQPPRLPGITVMTAMQWSGPECIEERRLINTMVNLCGDSTSTTAAPSKVTYTSILAALELLNEGLAERDRVTYTSLWNHARRHDSAEGRAAYWAARIDKELHRALWGHRGPVGRRSPHV